MRHVEDMAGFYLPLQARLALGLCLKMEGQVASHITQMIFRLFFPLKLT